MNIMLQQQQQQQQRLFPFSSYHHHHDHDQQQQLLPKNNMKKKLLPHKRNFSNNATSSSSSSSSSYDPKQFQYMEEERVIIVDENDNIIKHGSKLETHLNEYGPILHRAFSVFLFDCQGKLLLQQRAKEKITFPLYWTNTCCSHPLYNVIEMGGNANANDTDKDKDKKVFDPIIGVKKAAIRKLNHELGIQFDDIPIENFKYLTRIHYLANSNGKWGEHEIDYILFFQTKKSYTELELDINSNEIENIKYVTPQELKEMTALSYLKENDFKITPWCRGIIENFLYKWWSDIDIHDTNYLKLEKHVDKKTIHRLGTIIEENI